MAPRWFRLSAAFLLVAAACDCGDEMPPDDPFDGNVIVGDGTIPDAEEDAEADAAEDAAIDAAADTGDATDVMPDSGDRCSEPAVATLTSSQAIDQIGALAGMIVEITGTATRTALGCTEMACPPDDPCCNTCTGSVAIDGAILLSGGSCFTPPPGCSGTNCPGTVTCRPPLLGVPQTFKGTLIQLGNAVGLELFSVD
jgi:hypothetical protein